jgi:hypothetical protein
MDTGYPQLAATNPIAIIIIIAILPGPDDQEILLNANNHVGSMLYGASHNKTTSPQWDQKIVPSNQQEWAIHAQCHPPTTKGHLAHHPKPIQPL